MSKPEDSRRDLFVIILPSMPVFAAIWLALYRWLPSIATPSPSARLTLAFKWIALATLLCFVTGIEAVAHRRLFSRAINPLLGVESEPHRIDLRYLQHTLEQLIVFGVGLVGLALFAPRAVAPTACVWIIARFAFWIGYHRAPRFRGFGAAGMAQSFIVLGYVCARGGYDDYGLVGAVVPVVVFLAIEAVLFAVARRERERA